MKDCLLTKPPNCLVQNENKEFCPPVHLTARHDTEDFYSGEETLDTWLRERALANILNNRLGILFTTS